MRALLCIAGSFGVAAAAVWAAWEPTSPQSAPASAPSRAAPRYNVLFIIADDLSAELGCYGNPLVHSPRIDRLAAAGICFDRAYCQFPLCNPSRASILAGMRPASLGVLDNRTPPRRTVGPIPFLPEHFARHGYVTLGVGKVAHEAFADSIAWDRFIFDAKNPSYRPKAVEAGEEIDREGRRRRRGASSLRWKALTLHEEDDRDAYNATFAAAQLDSLRGHPFFLAVGFERPHLPFNAPKKYFDLYDPAKIPLPAHPPRAAAAAASAPNDDDSLSEDDYRKAVVAYYACISYIDAQVGKLLDALERINLSEETIVILTGDHGFSLGEHAGAWRKGSLHESVARVPLILRVPGRRGGAHCPRLVELVDLYPTLTDLCGLPSPAHLEGDSMTPLLDDPNRPWKRAAFTQLRRQRDGVAAQGVRTERYRYTWWPAAGTAELFDEQEDPDELKDLSGNPDLAEVRKKLADAMTAGWRAARPPPPAARP